MSEGRTRLIDVVVGVVCLSFVVTVVFAAADDITAQLACEAQLQRISNGYTLYMADHNGRLPHNRDYDSYPQYKLPPVANGPDYYMQRHPDAILDGPHSGPWYFTDQVAAYMTDTDDWICDRWVDANGWFTEEHWYDWEPYHPEVYTSYLQVADVDDKTPAELPAAPSNAFMLTHGSTSMLNGSGVYTNVHQLRAWSARTSFIHRVEEIGDQAEEDNQGVVGPLGLNGILFADGHVEWLRFWTVYDNSRGESVRGAGDANYYMLTPDSRYNRNTRRVEQP